MNKVYIKNFKMPKSCEGCKILSWQDIQDNGGYDFCPFVELHKFNLSQRHPKCPLGELKLSEDIEQELMLLETNAVEGLEQNQNTIDSQNAINNIRHHIQAQQEKIHRNEIDYGYDITEKGKYNQELKSKLDKIKELFNITLTNNNTARNAFSKSKSYYDDNYYLLDFKTLYELKKLLNFEIKFNLEEE